jgi:hypothetical protein
MNKLSAEAYAIIEGRHSDPFRYLGLHKEGDKTVVRAFLPEASRVAHCRTVPSATSCARNSATTSSSSRTLIGFHRS